MVVGDWVFFTEGGALTTTEAAAEVVVLVLSGWKAEDVVEERAEIEAVVSIVSAVVLKNPAAASFLFLSRVRSCLKTARRTGSSRFGRVTKCSRAVFAAT